MGSANYINIQHKMNIQYKCFLQTGFYLTCCCLVINAPNTSKFLTNADSIKNGSLAGIPRETIVWKKKDHKREKDSWNLEMSLYFFPQNIPLQQQHIESIYIQQKHCMYLHTMSCSRREKAPYVYSIHDFTFNRFYTVLNTKIGY